MPLAAATIWLYNLRTNKTTLRRGFIALMPNKTYLTITYQILSGASPHKLKLELTESTVIGKAWPLLRYCLKPVSAYINSQAASHSQWGSDGHARNHAA